MMVEGDEGDCARVEPRLCGFAKTRSADWPGMDMNGQVAWAGAFRVTARNTGPSSE
jgi:hypothetical protein